MFLAIFCLETIPVQKGTVYQVSGHLLVPGMHIMFLAIFCLKTIPVQKVTVSQVSGSALVRRWLLVVVVTWAVRCHLTAIVLSRNHPLLIDRLLSGQLNGDKKGLFMLGNAFLIVVQPHQLLSTSLRSQEGTSNSLIKAFYPHNLPRHSRSHDRCSRTHRFPV